MDIETRHGFLLFLQHGVADIAVSMSRLGRALAAKGTVIVNPGLNWFRTWWQLEPLVQTVEAAVRSAFSVHPLLPAHVVAHSMGGVLWLELLDRHPEWRDRTASLTLIGSPVGGVARWINPLGARVGILRDLEVDRRTQGERIAREVPTLSIAGDFFLESDGTVPVDSTRFPGARSIVLPGVPHDALRYDRRVFEAVRAFWNSLRGS